MTRADDELPVVVIGAGPAGIAAATWLKRLDVPLLWFEAGKQAGGTLLRVGNPVLDMPGIAAHNGVEAAEQLAAHARALGLVPRLETSVVRDASGRLYAVDGAGATHELPACAATILCTGTRPRVLGIDGERRLAGRGVEISVTRNLDRYAGAPVAVVGGGDAALEGALLLADRCPRVHLVHRGSTLRAQSRFVSRLDALQNVTLWLEREVASLDGADSLQGVSLNDGTVLHVRGLFVRIGVEASTPAGFGGLERDTAGYVRADADGRTSIEGVLAAGDVTGATHQSVAWSVGTGARAAATARARRDGIRGRTP